MRTDAEMLEFAKACEQIEKQGGDVLGYISQEYPSYTPRPTWYRLQKDWLGRKEHQLTEGKPKQEGVKYMGKMIELAKECLEAYGRGEKVFDYMESRGIKNPSAYWYAIKQHAKLKDPDLYEQLSVIRNPYERNQRPKDKPESKPEEVEKIFFGGKEYEKMDKPSPTCCQPAPESGVTVPDEIPDSKPTAPDLNPTDADRRPVYPINGGKIEFFVREISSKTGVWKYEESTNRYVFAAWKWEGNDTNVMRMRIEDWLNLAAEIPEALKALDALRREVKSE